ncbi:MAG TPA: lipase family protein [Candidatus Wunengus sp. YC60]|uniref:lipase family protein n=1 Tax=Candidatus Wunengus sp. YC60 TaxID=3367697 RepID=UPI004028F230
MRTMYFKYTELLDSPTLRAAYSDRTAWLMAEMSKLAYIKFEDGQAERDGLEESLVQAGFNLVAIFNGNNGTQGFLASREKDKMVVLSFRGTETNSLRDIKADLDARFYMDSEHVMIHNGFYAAFSCVEQEIRDSVLPFKDYALYVTGHSLGGALALIATRALNSDNLAACYTFGGPKVGNTEFADVIKPPIYRAVNALDPVPCLPDTYIINIFSFCIKRLKIVIPWLKKFGSYTHHGDQRFLTPCDDFTKVEIRANYNEMLRSIQIIANWIKNRKIDADDHAIDIYCEKLGQYALKRLKVAPTVLSNKSQLPVYTDKKGGLTLNIFDSYERYARLSPAILLVMPFIIACFSITPIMSGPIGTKLFANGLFVTSLFIFFSNIVRGLGKRIEPKVWEQWGGPPSTRFLRKDDTTIASEIKNKFYQKILKETGIDLVSDLTDERIRQAFVFVKEKLRRKDKQGLWIKSNKEYGFDRNLMGSRVYLIISSLVASISCLLAICFFPNDKINLLIAAVVIAIYGVGATICGWLILPRLTKEVADRYAEQAIMAYMSID